MTDRQRALVSSLVYTFRNKRFFSWHRIGVKRLPDGVRMYEFNGKVLPDSISLNDEKYNKIMDQSFLTNPAGVQIDFIGKRGTDTLKIVMPENSMNFYGTDGDYFQFEGTYYLLSDQVQIRDSSQDKDKYLYRIIW